MESHRRVMLIEVKDPARGPPCGAVGATVRASVRCRWPGGATGQYWPGPGGTQGQRGMCSEPGCSSKEDAAEFADGSAVSGRERS